jgi:hypothetical protein
MVPLKLGISDVLSAALWAMLPCAVAFAVSARSIEPFAVGMPFVAMLLLLLYVLVAFGLFEMLLLDSGQVSRFIIPCSMKMFSRLAISGSGAPVYAQKTTKRLIPLNASRTISNVHLSPRA